MRSCHFSQKYLCYWDFSNFCNQYFGLLDVFLYNCDLLLNSPYYKWDNLSGFDKLWRDCLPTVYYYIFCANCLIPHMLGLSVGTKNKYLQVLKKYESLQISLYWIYYIPTKYKYKIYVKTDSYKHHSPRLLCDNRLKIDSNFDRPLILRVTLHFENIIIII